MDKNPQLEMVKNLIPVFEEKAKNSTGDQKIALEKAIEAMNLALTGEPNGDTLSKMQKILFEIQNMKK